MAGSHGSTEHVKLGLPNTSIETTPLSRIKISISIASIAHILVAERSLYKHGHARHDEYEDR